MSKQSGFNPLGGGGSSKKHSGGKGKGSSKHHPHHHHNAHKGKHAAPPASGFNPIHPGVNHHGHGNGHGQNLGHPGAPLKVGDLSCCSIQALAQSLKMAGWPAGDDDIAALYATITDDPDRGAEIDEALLAAAQYGLAGVKPLGWEWHLRIPEPGDIAVVDDGHGAPHCVMFGKDGVWSWGLFFSHESITENLLVMTNVVSVRWPR